MLVELSKSVALLLMLCMVEEYIARKCLNRLRIRQLFSGILYGFICVIGMMSPINMGDGIIFDPRSVIMSVAGLFGGSMVGLIASVIASGYRIWIGGSGAAVGTSVIIASVLFGLAYRQAVERGLLKIDSVNLLVFGLLVNLIQIYLFTFLPKGVVPVIMKDLALPLVISFTIATVLLGTMLQFINSNIQTEQILAKSEKRFRDFAETTSDYLWEMDAELKFSYFSEQYEAITNMNPKEFMGKNRYESPIPGVDPKDWENHLKDLKGLCSFKSFK